MLTMIYMEMLCVPPIHQPIVAPPAVRVDDAVKGHLALDCACSGFGGIRDDSRVDFPAAFQNPGENRFTPGPVPFLPTNTVPAEIRFIDFNLAREGR